MSVYVFGIVILFLAVCTIIILLIPRRFRKKVAIILVAILLVFGSLFGAYTCNSSFKHFIDMNFNPTSQHVILDSELDVSLPKNTAFLYRFSTTGAAYVTKSSLDEIILVYSDLAAPGSFSNTVEKEKTYLSFQYEGQEFEITIEPYKGTENYWLVVDVVTADG